MRFQKLDLNLLHALDVLLDEQNITKAAKRLHLSQSATSSILGRLREYFDDELLANVGRHMVPTALALSLQEPVHQLLLQIQATLDYRPQFIPEQCDRHFRIIGSDYTSSILIAPVVQRLRREAPGVTLEILQPSVATNEQMLRGEADLLFMPKDHALEELQSEQVLEDTFCCIVCARNEWVGNTLSTEQYLSTGHVVTRFPGAVATIEELHIHATGLQRRVEITVNNFNAVPQMVIGTDRIGTMHTRLARKLANYFPIRLLPLPILIPKMRQMMQWHPYQERDPAHQWLRMLLREAAQHEPVLLEVS
jgi:LysR family nod box-dependent transcriptional activator